jgi:hypothetical protein
MKNLLFIILALICPLFVMSQHLEVEGTARISGMNLDNTVDTVVVRMPDGTLAVRAASTLSEIQVLSISNDTVFLSGGSFVKLPASADNLGNHIATQPVQLVNMTTAERDSVSNPTAGMLIYNSESGRIEFYQELPALTYLDIPNNANTETGCASIAQSFKVNSSFFINEIEAKIDFNGGTGDVTLKIYDGEGVGGTELYSEAYTFAGLPVQNVNEYNFVLTNPLFSNCCPTNTFEITQADNTNMTAHIDFRDMVAHDVTSGNPNPDGYPDGKFYKDGMNSDTTDASNPPIIIFTRRDLDFKMTTQRKQWTQ